MLHVRICAGAGRKARPYRDLKIATLIGNSPEICRRHYAALIPEGLAAEVEFGTTLARGTTLTG